MKNTITLENAGTYLLRYLRETVKFGHTYVHSDIRAKAFGWEGLQCAATLADGTTQEIRVTWEGWGRSLQAKRGHKYKVHAHLGEKRMTPKQINTIKTIVCQHSQTV